jgi:hypothetical protein
MRSEFIKSRDHGGGSIEIMCRIYYRDYCNFFVCSLFVLNLIYGATGKPSKICGRSYRGDVNDPFHLICFSKAQTRF